MAKGRVLIALFVAALPFNLLIFPYRTKTLRAISGNDNPTLDTDFFYTPAEAYELFEKLGPRGRYLYVWTEVTADLIYPIIYALLLSLLLIHIFRKLSKIKLQHAFAALPWAGMLFDFCENFLVAAMLFAYPRKLFWAAGAAGWFTKLKWIFVSASLAAVSFGLIWLAIRPLKRVMKTNQRRP